MRGSRCVPPSTSGTPQRRSGKPSAESCVAIRRSHQSASSSPPARHHPEIAAISGWCLAGGLELALWCDLRIATQESALGFPERRWGVPLVDGGTQRLPRIVGLGRALDLILTGRIVDAEEALSMGLLTEIVPAGRHVERALEFAEALARFPQDTMLADRRAAIEGIGLTFEEGLALESESGGATQATAWAGAARFSGGEGRGGAGSGV